MRCSMCLIGLFTIVSCVAFAGSNSRHDHELAAISTNLETLHKITDQPHPMMDTTAALCAPSADAVPHSPHEGSFEAAWCNVYVNEKARKTMLSGEGIYPVGSLIVKSKLPQKEKPDQIELFTVMRKMTDDYDPKHGNWEYAIVDGKSRRVFASGKIESCITCHEPYKKTDYVTRAYLQKNKETPPAPADFLK